MARGARWAPAFSWLVPFPCFPQSVFRSLQPPVGPLDDLVFGMTLEPGVHRAPHGPDLLRCLGDIDVKHLPAPIAYQVHGGRAYRVRRKKPGRSLCPGPMGPDVPGPAPAARPIILRRTGFSPDPLPPYATGAKRRSRSVIWKLVQD
jgi:hypothetical protein